MIVDPGATFTAVVDNAPTGLVGTMGVRIEDGAGTDVVARTTAGIVEIDPGVYSKANLVAPATAGNYVIVWDNGTLFTTEDLWVTSIFTDIKAKTDNLPSDPADASDVAGLISTLQTTITAVKAKTDNLPVDPADASDVAALISTLQTTVNAVKTKTDNLPADPADASDVAALISTAQAGINAIKAKTDNLPIDPADASDVAGLISSVQTVVNSIQAKTNLIPAAGPPSAADYTAARATKLDQLDATVSSRLAASAYVVPDNATISLIYAAIDTEIAAIQSSVNAVKLKTDNLPVDPADASDVAALIAAAQSSLNTLTTRLTDTRATNLDKIDVAVSTRLAAAAYTAPDNAGISAIKAKTDHIPDDIDYQLANMPGAVWNMLTASISTAGSFGRRIIDFLDVAVGTRLASSSYVAPDNATVTSIFTLLDPEIATIQSLVTSIKAKTDALPIDPADASDISTSFDSITDTLNEIKVKTDLIAEHPDLLSVSLG